MASMQRGVGGPALCDTLTLKCHRATVVGQSICTMALAGEESRVNTDLFCQNPMRLLGSLLPLISTYIGTGIYIMTLSSAQPFPLDQPKLDARPRQNGALVQHHVSTLHQVVRTYYYSHTTMQDPA